MAQVKRLLPLVAVLAVLAPTVVLRYLPMTDLPQHAAVVSILDHLRDPSYGFEPYYELALGRTLYVLPYVLALLLAKVMPVMWAMKLVAALATAAYPIGAWLLLRALKKPGWLVLLTLPLVYNRAFYWGFINFLLAIGLALAALAVVIAERRGWRSDVLLAVLCLAVATTHIYGVAFLIGYLVVWLFAGERGPIWRRLPALAPAVIGTAAWTLLASRAPPYGGYEYVDPPTRVIELPIAVLGGYRDGSELCLILAWLAVFALVSAPSLPITWERWYRLGRHERIAYAYAALNLILYFALPLHTPTVKYLHFRHALLAALLLPLCATGSGVGRWPRLAGGALAALTLFAFVNPAIHLARFDREASGFSEIVAGIPQRARVVGLIYDPDGKVMKTFPYLHFPAYSQTVRGGLIVTTFPRMFWNLPVRFKEGSGVPGLTSYIEWKPQSFSDKTYGRFYGFAIVRRSRGMVLPADFPFEKIAERDEWQLYRRR